MSAKALEGVKVLELCSFVAGPYCARLLADMGADVIKVEPPDIGDHARHRLPFYEDLPGSDRSLLFFYLNTDKLGITLNLSTATGHRIFMELVSQVDILVEDMTAIELHSLGLTSEMLHQRNPSLIVASISPFGRTGPYSEYKAHYLNTYHSGGDAYTTPAGQLQDEFFLEREPIKLGGYAGEYQAGITANIAILGALVGRSRDGLGHHIDLSKQEALANLNAANLGRYPNKGTRETRQGAYLAHYVGGMFRCKDGFWDFLINSQRSWEALVAFMGDPDWVHDTRFLTHEDRVKYRREIEDRIEVWAMDYTREELYHGLQQRGCPVGPVYKPTELVQDKQMRERGFWAQVHHPSLGQVEVPSTGTIFARTPVSPKAPPPSLGQHNQDVYCTWLGMATEELAALRRAGVI